jgi:hypothetical protein
MPKYILGGHHRSDGTLAQTIHILWHIAHHNKKKCEIKTQDQLLSVTPRHGTLLKFTEWLQLDSDGS